MGLKRIKAVLFVGSYNEQYPRNAIMIKGLKQKGILVDEFNIKKKGIIHSIQFNKTALGCKLVFSCTPNYLTRVRKV